MTAWKPSAASSVSFWAASGTRIVSGPAGKRTYHVVRVTGLEPGKRYYYRLHDPATVPTAQETAWGAQVPWRREWAVSTQAGKDRRTIMRLPVKVLLMPNVLNIASARRPDGSMVPRPAPLTEAEIARLRQEYAITSRFFFINSGMRYWVDFQIQVDDRWQRWGDEPASVAPEYKGWPVSRSYAGKDFDPPGGGTWTIVDTRNPQRVATQPVYEATPYAAQIEQAFPRRWNEAKKAWEFYSSGGGTFGVDGFPRGVPARSQYLGGSDTAWLAAHEFHHQMESEGAFSFSQREDDRIVFDHPSPRSRENAWTTAGRHGEHWDVLAFWDRTLTDAQWLRIYFGETLTVADRDNDGVPDEDSRLPFDEKRFGSDPKKAMTDGQMSDLVKAMLSTWAPAPLQFTFSKPPLQSVAPDPRNPDSDRDGRADGADPYPLYPYAPFVWPLTANVDGDTSEWAAIPLSGQKNVSGGIALQFRQAHDDAAYYGAITVSGSWKRVRVMLDGEGKGVFSGEGREELTLTNDEKYTVRKSEYAVSSAKRRGGSNGADWEFALPNRGEGKWFWERGGREVGVSIEVTDDKGAVWSVYEPYHLFYARMLESAGKPPLPTGAPPELTREQATKTILPGDPALKTAGTGWRLESGALRHSGEDEGVAFVELPEATGDFDLWVRLEARQDAVLGAFTPETKEMGAGSDYIAFVGGYVNTVTRLRLFGREAGDDGTRITPGEHTMQLTRRGGRVWCLFDGRPVLFAPDPDPKKRVNRLAIIGGYNGAQVIHEIRYRAFSR